MCPHVLVLSCISSRPMSSRCLAVCRVPLTSILLIFELTRNYTAIVPACGAVGLSYFISYQGERIVDAYFDREARLASSERASPLGKDLVVAPPSIRMALSSGVSADGLGGPWGASARAEGQDWESLRARLLEAGAGGKPVTSALSRDVVVVRESEDLKGALAAMEGAGQGMAVVVGNDGTFRGVVSADEVRSSLMVLGAGRGEAGPG